jgi:serpin B
VDTETPVAVADEAFGVDLYLTLAEGAADTIFSPASVAAALQMALCGARGQTAAELASALHLSGADAAAAGLRTLSAVVRDVTATDDLTFRVANTAWVQSGLPLVPGFTERLRDDAEAKFADADFIGAAEAARGEINRVIKDQTDGKITDLLGPGTINALTRLVLANAVYLKASWADPFQEKATREAPFYPAGHGESSRPVPMMRGTATRSYLSGDGYQAVLLPYRGGRLAMAVVLPDGPLAGLRRKVAATGLSKLLAGTSQHQVTLSMPRFRLEASYGLIPVLRRLGVSQAFGDQADFSGITRAEALHIGAIAHKAYIDVDEHGTEAAAATAVVMMAMAFTRPPPPVDMVVDRPFLFAIIDTPTGMPLFLGQVTNPRASH